MPTRFPRRKSQKGTGPTGSNLVRSKRFEQRIDAAVTAIDEGAVRRGLEACEPRLQRGRKQSVVGVEKYDVARRRLPEPAISRRRQAGIRLGQETNPFVPGCDRSRIIGRTVVDDDDLIGPERLPNHAVEGVGKETRLVEHVHDDRDRRRVLRRGFFRPRLGPIHHGLWHLAPHGLPIERPQTERGGRAE